MSTAASRSPFIVRFLSGCAVLSCLVQWTWTLLVLAYPFFNSDVGKLFLPPKPTTPQPTISPIQLPNSIELIIMGAVVIFALALCVIALIWVPREASRTAEKTSQKTAKVLVPIITHHQRLSAKETRRLTARIIWWIKFILVLMPFALLLLTPLFSNPIDTRITLIFGAILLVITVLWSGLALLFGQLFARRSRL